MKLILALFALFISYCASADPFAQANAQHGQQMFTQYHCSRCHTNMYGGDGSGIFTRPNRKVNSPDQLIAQIGMCGGNVDKDFSEPEKLDLAAYLNRYYQFK